MKKLVFVSFCALSLFFSCKKSGSSPAATASFSATINGTEETFNNGAIAYRTVSSGTYLLAIAGLNGKDTSSDKLSIGIASTSPIVAGTYSDAVLSDKQLTTIVLEKAGGVLYTFDPTIANSTQVTITSITGSRVQGTFTSVLDIDNTGNPTTPKTITNGKFDVSLVE